jgi:hypothetical protein
VLVVRVRGMGDGERGAAVGVGDGVGDGRVPPPSEAGDSLLIRAGSEGRSES